MKALKHLNKYFFKYKWKFLFGIVITILAKLFLVISPELVGDSVTLIEQYNNQEITSIQEVKQQLLKNILYLLGATLTTGILTFFMRQTIINMSRYIEYDLKNEIYQQYQKLSQNFYKQHRTGDLMSRITEDVSKVRMYAGPALMYSINTLALFVIVIGVMYKEAPKLTLLTLIPLPILSILIYKISRIINKRSEKVQLFLAKLNTFTQEIFSGISVVKAYAIEPEVNSNFEVLANQSKKKQLQLIQVQAFFIPSMILLIGVSNLLVIYFGGLQYINGTISLGVITKFIIYVNLLTWPVATVGWVTSIVQEAEASQKRINAFLDIVPEIQNPVAKPTTLKGAITFKNVSFTYKDTKIKALQNISFHLNPGETLGIIGTTGSGKTTLLNLIARLYDVDSGTLLIDAKSITTLNLNSLRNAIGFVPQDAFLFSDTIKNNISFGKETATEQEISTAAKKADVHKNIITFKNGYQTVLGERGITLSGGQKQRVAIARAILKDSSILLFDDSLSAVDTETEETILQNLSNLMQKQTCIIVSHRISSIKNANTILVLDEGKIIQQGTHEQLLNTKGYYQELYNKQLSE